MKKVLALEYNSTRDPLLFSEYGRSIQKMVQFAKSVENREERQATVEAIIEIINQLNPQTRNVNEYKQRLWKNLFKMAEYDLDVDYPFEGDAPREEDNTFRPDKVPYPQHEFPWKHYGYNIRVMIDKAMRMEEGPIKQGFIENILSYMKLSYRTWNKEHFVSDDIIISDLAVMSKNMLSVDDNHTIEVNTKANQPNADQSAFLTPKKQKQKQKQQQPQQKQQQQNKPANKQKQFKQNFRKK
jgi:hypothetical protein